MTDDDWRAASRATGTYEPSRPRQAPALTPATQPTSTPGRVHSRPADRSFTRAKGGNRSKNRVGTLARPAMMVASTRAVVRDCSASMPATSGPISSPTADARFIFAIPETAVAELRTTCVWLPVQNAPRAHPCASSQRTNGTRAAETATIAVLVASISAARNTSSQSG